MGSNVSPQAAGIVLGLADKSKTLIKKARMENRSLS